MTPRKYEPKRLPDGTPNARHTPDARRGSRHKARAKSGFVAWDGEGVTDSAGVHRYILLANSEGLAEVDPEGLSSARCFDLLLESYSAHRKAYHVGFAFGYDVNMMLRDVPIDELRALWQTGNCEWNGYTIHYKNRREFRLKRGRATAQVWDVWGFFQGTFVGALKSYGRHEAAQRIQKLKEQRHEFTLERIPEIVGYCHDECNELAGMMGQFAEYLEQAGLRLQRYDGAGAIAGSLMRKYGVHEYKRKIEWARTRNGTPEQLREAVLHSYYGGRIELVQYGHAPTLPAQQYDLRSAYPSMMQHVPCLRCGSWKRFTDGERGAESFAVYRVRWNLKRSDTVGPFPWRDTDGAIFFPQRGEGWYWRPEVDAAFDALSEGVIHGRVKIVESWRYRTRCTHKPFAWIPDLYRQRLEWQEQGIGAEKVLKLGLNSLYGKTAQRVGGREGPPTWHQLEWAGYVTSGARAAVFRAAFPAIRNGTLIQFATDAVFTCEPLPDLDTSKELGAWDSTPGTGFTGVQSGVYWYADKASKMRGFERNDALLNPHVIAWAWKHGEKRVEFEIRRFITLGRALTGPNQFAIWRRWIEQRKSLSLTPLGTKRTIMGLGNVHPADGLVLTLPTDPHVTGVRMSTPIRLPWLHGASGGEPAERQEERRRNAEQDEA